MRSGHAVKPRVDALATIFIGLVGAALLVRQLVHATSTPGIDFVHVWRAGHDLLSGSGAYGDPMFTYPPGSAVLLAPFGLLDYRHAQLLSLALNASSILVASWLALVLLQRRPSARAVSIAVLALGASDAVGSTWANGNINGFLLLLEVAALLAMQRSRWVAGAALVGLSLAIKPVLLPMLLVFALRRQWRALTVAVAVPALLTIAGWIVVPDSDRFVTSVVPFLMHGAQLDFNDSLVGVGHLLSWPGWVVAALRLILAAAAMVLLALRARMVEDTSAAELCQLVAALLAVTFLVAPMSETYYTLYLLPGIAAWALDRPRAAVAAGSVIAAFFATFRLAGEVGSGGAVSVPLALRPSVGWVVCTAVFAVAVGRASVRAPQRAVLVQAHRLTELGVPRDWLLRETARRDEMLDHIGARLGQGLHL